MNLDLTSETTAMKFVKFKHATWIWLLALIVLEVVNLFESE